MTPTLNVEPELATHARRLGGRVIAKELRNRLASSSASFGLRCELEHLPPIPEGSISLTMEPCTGSFDGFAKELGRTAGPDYGRVLRRQRLHEAEVRTLHVAWTEDREPVYVQWLVTPENRVKLDAAAVDYWPPFAPDEVLLEFAYTFTPFRGKGVMGDGMGQLLRIAAEGGASVAYTYVNLDNIPSLRGCAKVGFELDHLRDTSIRLGVRRGQIRPPTAEERTAWEKATAPRR